MPSAGFDPALVAATQAPGLWDDLDRSDLLAYVVRHGAATSRPRRELLRSGTTSARLFARVIDARSHYTLTHSRGVTETAMLIAQRLGIAEPGAAGHCGALLCYMTLASLACPRAFWTNPGKLDACEWAVMQQHTRYTYENYSANSWFLSPSLALRRRTMKRLDGSGYCEGISGMTDLSAVADTCGR